MITNHSNTPVAQRETQRSNSLQTSRSSQTFAAFPSASPSLQSIIQLIQVLIQQLQSSSPQENNKAKEGENKPLTQQHTGSVIKGTSGDDRLNGTRSKDRMSGLAGNDRLYGRQNDDTLLGNKGNDRLYGGKGNDTLHGGKGDDYLSGGRGQNRLFGGEGNDTLYTRLGSDIFDGGEGNDTARIRASFDDFSVEFKETSASSTRPVASDDTDTFILTNEKTGQTIEVTNIEKFKFNDARLSVEELRALATNNPLPSTLNLTDQQQEAVGARFNNRPAPNLADGITTTYTGVATDKNDDGVLGVGDTVQLHLTGGLLGLDETQDHVLTTDDLAVIEEDRSNPLLDISQGLSFEQNQRLHTAIFGDRISLDSPSIQSVFDHNSDKKLSVGDTILINRFSEATGATSIDFHVLTQKELDTYPNGSESNQQARTDFEANKQKWGDTRPNNYSFTLERSGFLAGEARKPVDLTVTGNTVTNAQFTDGSAGQVPDFNQLTIGELFNTIEQALDNNAAEVRVEYDATTGIPQSIFVDQSQLIADEEVFLSTSNFQSLL